MIKKKKIERIPLSEVLENINDEDYNLIGVVGRHHGKEGEVKVFSYVEDLDFFENSLHETVRLFDKNTGNVKHLRVQSEKYAKANSFYVKFEEINSLKDAESILNYEIYLKNNQLPDIDNGYYFFEVIDSVVVENGKKIGKITDVIRTGSNDVFEILQDDGKKFLVPVIERYIKNIDKTNKIVEIVKPVWK
jgi:16S rRNA processing protein RimM